MNKKVSFILGFLIGAAGGSAVTYYISKDKFQAEKDEEMEEMEEYYQDRFKRKLEKVLSKTKKKPEKKIEENSLDREDEKIASNEGVKKYHHENGLESAYGSNRIFGEDAKPKKEKESKLINEVSEEEFLNAENGYTKQTVDVFMSYDDEEPEIVGIWAYNTDNEESVDKRFNKSIEQLLNGRKYEELLTYCGEDDIGQLYLKNDELMTDFEFIIHND